MQYLILHSKNINKDSYFYCSASVISSNFNFIRFYLRYLNDLCTRLEYITLTLL